MRLTYAFFIVIAIIMPLAVTAVKTGGNKNRCLNKTDSRAAIFFVILIAAVIVVFAGFRHITGANIDEYAYRNRIISYKEMSFTELLRYGTEYLMTIPVWIMSHLTQNTQFIILWCSAVTYILFVYCIYKFCDNFELGILLLFLLNIVNLSFNVMQQVEAAAVLMLGIPFIYKKDFKKYLVVVLLASMIHMSALFMIAVYFLANMKPWSKGLIGVSVAFVVAMVLFDSVAPRIFSALGLYENYLSTISGGGVKLITVLVAFVPFAFAFFFKKILPQDDPLFNCCVNITLLYALIYIVALKNVYVGRFAIFIQPWLIIFYTKLITFLKKERWSSLVYYVLLVGYGATTLYFTSKSSYEFMLGK